MPNFRLSIEYDGTAYHGWQVQNGKGGSYSSRSEKTIQRVLERVIRKVLQDDIRLTVAGRTDAGVHALSQVANFKSSSSMPLNRMRWAFNCLLPEDIKVLRISRAKDDFNSRFCAKSKLYRYTILNRKYSSPLLARRVYFFCHRIDAGLMRREAKVLLGKHDFTSFQASERRQRNPVRNIKRIRISKDKDLLHIDIEADSFLYNMVRNIAGTLLEIGRGRFPEGSMKKILESRNRRSAGPTLPAKGLCLLKVRYR
ncbi:MAG: tRNA pseudouridine(38-40) synthase TruA [Candidatus Omnitrophota bacterium]